MSANGDAETQTGVSLLVSVDEQSLRSARADIEDALSQTVSVAVDVESPESVAPDVESPVGEDIGAPDPPDAAQSDALEPDAILPAREESVSTDGGGVPDSLPEDIADAQAGQGLSPSRRRRFARREHRWADSRTQDLDDLLDAVRDIEDNLEDNLSAGGGGLLGGLLDTIGGVVGDFGGAAALTGAAAALTGSAKALTAAAIALGGQAVLDTVGGFIGGLFGGDGGSDSEDGVEGFDPGELESLAQEAVGFETLADLQRETRDAVQSLSIGDGGGGGGGILPGPGFDLPDLPDGEVPTLDPPTIDLPDIIDGDDGRQAISVEPNPLPVSPETLAVDVTTPLPVERPTLPVATPTLPVETPVLSTEEPVLSVETPTLEVEQPTLQVDAPGAIPLTPVPVPAEPTAVIAPPGGGGGGNGGGESTSPGFIEGLQKGGENIADTVGDLTEGTLDTLLGGGVFGTILSDLFTQAASAPTRPPPGDGVGGENSGALGRRVARQDQSETGPSQPETSQPVVVDSDVTATVNLGDITAEITANFDRLKQDLLSEVQSALDQQEREFEAEIDRIERQIEDETRDIRREISTGLRT